MNPKKIGLFLTAALLIISLGTKAQSADTTNVAMDRATAMTEKMKARLNLTDDQVPRVQTINSRYAEKNREIFTGSGGRFAKFRALKSSQKQKDKEMKAVLDKDQYKQYEAMKEEMKNKAMEEYRNRRE